jgi:hypothetical protein
MNRWVWIAHYHDGTTIRQTEFNEVTGKEWSSDHLDPDRLKSLTLEPEFSDHKGRTQPRVVLEFEKGTRFKRFWRRYATVHAEDDSVTEFVTWVIAIQKDGVTFYNFFRPNGEWVLSTNPEGSDFTV